MSEHQQTRWRHLVVMGVVVTALGTGMFTSHARAAVYWGSAGDVGITNLDGSVSRYFRPGLFPIDTYGGVAVSANHLYWHGMHGIGRAGMGGSSPPEWIATPVPHQSGLSESGGLAVDGSYIYWGNYQTGTLGRASVEGGLSDNAFITGLGSPCGVAVDSSYVYWTDGMGIGRARLDGSEAERGFIPGAGCGVAVDGQHVYWGSYSGRIGRADLDGGNADSEFITGVGEVLAVATNSSHVFWTDSRDGMFASIGRANLNGTEVNREFIVTHSYGAYGIALDERVATPAMPESAPIRFGRLRRNKRRGIVMLDVFAAEAGQLELRGPWLGWKVRNGVPVQSPDDGSYRWRLKLWPGTKGRVARRIRRQLLRRGRASVVLRLTYSESGKLPTTATKRILFLKDAGRLR